ncbi:MAG: type II toxin-antitoxin system VapC family toxin [Syntrophomonadaceae bacterium]|jgi:predicted nucleic acid-binding protein|nr:type II toxin-antitoxin system VapC family toxin [Syntrophomonadaceae bacterium]
MISSFVIDASVIVSWFSPDEQNGYAKDVLFCLKKEQAATPCLCLFEVNNVLRMLEKKEKLSGLQVDKALAALDKLRIVRDGAPTGFQIPLVLRLSRAYGLTIYDACYLELAVRLNLPIASLDNDLIKAAKAAEIEIKTA